MVTKTTEFICQKCGACCELFGKMAAKHFFKVEDDSCPNYDEKNRLCIDYKNRPEGCITKKTLGDQYQIDTCRLLRTLRKWGSKLEDKTRLDRIVATLISNYFGATPEQIEKVKKEIGG